MKFVVNVTLSNYNNYIIAKYYISNEKQFMNCDEMIYRIISRKLETPKFAFWSFSNVHDIGSGIT